jgi:glycosyltransferase involved in cell wall biosynthesis
MKILYLCADRGIPLHGSKGAAAHVRGLVRAFARLGHHVTVMAHEASTSRTGTGDAVDIVELAPPWLSNELEGSEPPRVARALGHIWMNPVVEAVLRRRLADDPPDLIYERYSPFGVAGSMCAAAAGIPHILEVNAPLAWEGRQYRRQALQEAADLLERTAFARAQNIVVVSRELRDLLTEQGVDEARIMVVPNGVDDELFRAPPTVSHESAVNEPVVVGFSGSLKPWHGIELLCEAFEMLASDQRFRLLVIGDGPGAAAVEEVRKRHGDRVTLTGAVPHEEVPRLLRDVDIAVAPYSKLERFYYSPLKLLEYMAAGVPTVASAIGQVSELIRDGATGILVPPGDADALRDAIVRLADDSKLRKRIGREAALEAATQHSWLDRARTILGRVAVPV